MARRIWRLCRARYASTAFDGAGAARTGNRWNERGVRIAYAAGSLSLAALEYLVHVSPGDAPDDLVAIPAVIPRGVRVGVPRALPADWRAMPPSDASAKLGSAWARRGRTAVLRVPSVIVPGELDYLVNPAHPDVARLEVGPAQAFSFDPRLLVL